MGPTERRLAERKLNLDRWAAGALDDWKREKGRPMSLAEEVTRLRSLGLHDLADKAMESAPLGGKNRAARPSYQRHARANIGREQATNWGMAPTDEGGRQKAEGSSGNGRTFVPTKWGLRPTGICLNGAELMGPSDFKYAAGYTLPFTRFKGKKLLDVAATFDGLAVLHWLNTKAEVKSANLKKAVSVFLADPRCAEAVAEVEAFKANRPKGQA